MTSEPSKAVSPSFFWNCITLNDDCPFFSSSDPRLYYFGVGLVTIYATLFLTILADLNFYWTIDNLQQRVDYCINFLKQKLRRVDMDQHKLVSTQQRTEKQIKRSRECTRIVTALRGAVTSDDPIRIQAITGSVNDDYLNVLRNVD